jgi:hypothetical protein
VTRLLVPPLTLETDCTWALARELGVICTSNPEGGVPGIVLPQIPGLAAFSTKFAAFATGASGLPAPFAGAPDAVLAVAPVSATLV